MSGSPVRSFNSNSSDISLTQPPDPPRTKKRPRRATSPIILDQSHQEAIIHQISSRNSYFEFRDLEPQHVLMNHWIKMKTEFPEIYLGILYANILVSLFIGLVIAGIVVIPVTFASVRNSRALDEIGKAGNALLVAILNIPFLWVAGTSFIFGITSLLWFWWENRTNHIWLEDRVLLPLLHNVIVGLIATLIDVYGIQDGHWYVTAVINIAVTVYLMLATMIFHTLYTFGKEQFILNEQYVAQ